MRELYIEDTRVREDWVDSASLCDEREVNGHRFAVVNFVKPGSFLSRDEFCGGSWVTIFPGPVMVRVVEKEEVCR